MKTASMVLLVGVGAVACGGESQVRRGIYQLEAVKVSATPPPGRQRPPPSDDEDEAQVVDVDVIGAESPTSEIIQVSATSSQLISISLRLGIKEESLFIVSPSS